jgi:Protein of unknown function (DUF4242)
MTHYLVEMYLPGSGDEQVRDAETRATAATAAMRREGTAIRYLRSVFVPEDETCFHTFTADSIDAVGTAAERAELSPLRIVEARVRR